MMKSNRSHSSKLIHTNYLLTKQRTIFEPISIDDAKTLHQCYEELVLNKNSTLSEPIKQNLEQLESKIQVIDNQKRFKPNFNSRKRFLP